MKAFCPTEIIFETTFSQQLINNNNKIRKNPDVTLETHFTRQRIFKFFFFSFKIKKKNETKKLQISYVKSSRNLKLKLRYGYSIFILIPSCILLLYLRTVAFHSIFGLYISFASAAYLWEKNSSPIAVAYIYIYIFIIFSFLIIIIWFVQPRQIMPRH